jgi:hypothetical protein
MFPNEEEATDNQETTRRLTRLTNESIAATIYDEMAYACVFVVVVVVAVCGAKAST